ncbi:MFS transporter [Sulfurirhabdus autotrophica]|uniref:UMF1 family MFS transporter n=1 Tax=Sulfurirhabdus autotrophica TaxID=1706046 RepID=A0A4V2W0V8_9PROT|nr:MFS transporter [Sulfurirhabdus autotrophica]TCV80109.1 UMF1 family MFS transporter [Sulfurirhabdus autotrophica]
MHRSLAKTVTSREIWSWAMYDFANSGYTTVVITAIFNAYFVSVVAGNAPWATLAWTLALAVSYTLIMLFAPVIGAYADAYAAKKKLLAATTIGCVIFTALLAFAGPNSLWLTIPLIVFSNFFYGCGENLIAAFLPELARGRALGKVSGWGWSLGYVGGLVSLGACLAYVTWAQGHNQKATDFVPVTMLITAALFALSSLPTFMFLKERALPQPHLQGLNIFQESFARLGHTLRRAKQFRDLRRFLICTVFYQAGIQAVITLAAIYAQQAMHFTTQQTIMLIFVVNITAAIGAFLFGHVQDRIGHIPTIALTLFGWIGMILLAWGAEGPTQFWIAANLAGVCMGSSQSAGRALVGFLSPAARRAEFFGLWGLAVKFSSILGPITYGLVSWISKGDHRLAILITGSYFVAGLLILAGIDVKRGRRVALRKENQS